DLDYDQKDDEGFADDEHILEDVIYAILVREIQDQIRKQFDVKISKMKAFKANRIASDKMTGFLLLCKGERGLRIRSDQIEKRVGSKYRIEDRTKMVWSALKKKDASTSLHKASGSFRIPRDDGYNLLIDLDAPFLWRDCVLNNLPDVACGLEEGCRFPARLTVYSTNGRNPTWGANFPFGTQMVISCAPKNILPSIPNDVYGVLAFSWSALAFPKLQNPDVADKFGLCLATTSSAVGVAFLGTGPFYFTSLPKVDLRSFFSYTPMIRKDSKSLGFYIHLNQILIKEAPVALPTLKSQSEKLSTTLPYTTLRSDIYIAFATSFSKAAANIPSVNAVKPFSLYLIEAVLLFGAIVVDSLDPMEQNFLFDTDDNSLGGFANMFEDETDNSQAFHSLLSGSLSALMQLALEETSSTDTWV
nr:aspartic peptidase A1 family [Tanacetum cinerariifolium]GEY04560.1 aspartic peptidase A1 family [Tanacetum cinerariifolium]